MTLASWGNSTSPKLGLEVLSPRDSLWSSTHEGSTRVTHATFRNSASVELQGKKCCLYKMPYMAAPIWVPRWRHCKFYALRATFYRRTYKSQKFFFLFTSDTFRKRPVLSYQDSYMNFYKEIYEQRWYRKRTTYRISGGVPQEYLKRLYKQTPLWLVVRSRSLRIPEKQDDHKKRDIEQSAPTHVRHTHCIPMQLGTTADQRYDVHRDWLQEACQKARVRWGTRCKESCSEEGPHYRMERSARNHLECNQVQRAPEKLSSSCRQTSNNQPYSQVWKSLWDSFPELYCIDLAEAYVTQESVSSRI